VTGAELLSVTSPDGPAATWDDLAVVAAAWEGAAARVAWLAAGSAADALHAGLGATVALSPTTGWAACGAVATCAGAPGGDGGVGGLARCAAGLLGDAATVRWVAGQLREADDAVRDGFVRIGGLAAVAWGDDGVGDAVLRPDLVAPAATARSAATLADLLAGLAPVAALAATAPGTVAVRSSGPPGARRHVLLLPGTDDMVVPPRGQDADVRDLTTNLRLLAGQPTAYEAGLREALAAAGVRPGEPLLVVGHSQGGMAALALTDDVGGPPLAVAAVLTAGSPLAHAPPAGSPGPPVLALEHAPDVVPLLDGVDDAAPGGPRGATTVRFDLPGEPSATGAHEVAAYVAGAAAAERSGGPAVAAYVDRLRAAGFLTAGDGDGGGDGAEGTAGTTTVLVQVVRR